VELEQKFKAKTLIASFLFLYEESSSVDEIIREEIGSFEAVIQIRVKEHDDISSYLEFKNKRIFAHVGEIHDSPDATILLNDLQTVMDFISGSVPTIDLFLKGRLQIIGRDQQEAMKKVLKLQSIHELLRFYIEPIKNTRPSPPSSITA